MRRFLHIVYAILLCILLPGTGLPSNGHAESVHQICDSLKNRLATQKLTAKQRLELLEVITDTYSTFEMDSLMVFAPMTIKEAQKQKNHRIEIICYFHWAMAHCFKGDYSKAHEILEQARTLAEEKGSKRQQAKALSLIAFNFGQQKKYSTAIDYYLGALEKYEKQGVYDGCVGTLLNLAVLNRKLNNKDIAINYLHRASGLIEDQKELPNYWYERQKVAIYSEHAANSLNSGELENAAKYALLADSITAGVGIISRCNVKCLLANIYLQFGQYDTAFKYAGEALEYAEILKSDNLYMGVWKIFSDIYLKQGRYREAESFALKIFHSDSLDVDISRDAVANLTLTHIYMGHTGDAIRYFEKYAELNNDYTKKSYHLTVSDLSVKYETEQKEARIVDLEQQSILYSTLGIAGILLAISFGALLRQKIKNSRREKQLIATRSVLNGEMNERTRIAHDLHDRLGGSLAAVKINLMDDSISRKEIETKLNDCIEEIRSAAHNLMPVSLQYGIKAAMEDFTGQFPNVQFYFFGEEKRFDQGLEFLIYCCANELISNSIKHSGAKNIVLQVIHGEEYISLTVQDDGCGFEHESAKAGMGLYNIADRVASNNGVISIHSSPEKGTETIIEFKLKMHYDKDTNCG